MRIVAVIPARLASSRFPNKIIHKIHGLEMIEHVRRRVVLSDIFDDIYVASGDDEIISLINGYGGKAIKTFKNHLSGTSRVVEAIQNIEATHLVLVQGDEPLILPQHLLSTYQKINISPDVAAWNATSSLMKNIQLDRRSEVKCIVNCKGRILYCFRKTPSFSEFIIQKQFIRKMLGLIAFKKETIFLYEENMKSVLEKSEDIEQLRLIENNINFRSIDVEPSLPSVNEYEDKAQVLKFIEDNKEQKELLEKVLRFKK